MDRLRTFIDLPLKYHLIVGTFVRLALIFYANYHDENFDVDYTDIDYKVFTDAARHVYNGKSPYKRLTYRYSPLIAYLLVPNIFLLKEFGKILFTIFDIFITLAVKKLVEHQLGRKGKKTSLISTYCALFWLYNPLSVAISTRGNADSVPCFFIIMSIFLLQTDVVKSVLKYALSGILLGISIHLRLYPLCFSFPMYLSIADYRPRRVTFKLILLYLLPNKNQLILASSCILTLVSLTVGMYYLYGYEFLFETYIYHIFRKDTKHNFSVLFYYSYLSMDERLGILKSVVQCLMSAVLLMLSLTFGNDPKTLPFGLFCQTVVLVAYNSVVTSQYFVWFLSLLPLVVHSLKMRVTDALMLVVVFLAPQAAWLFFAYLLEFKCKEVFLFIWAKSVIFFCANIIVLCQLIKSFKPDFGFGQVEQMKTKKQT